jgi:hypothetical protein
MEPRQEEQKDKVPRTEEKEAKPRRFRIIKLEERIAPSNGKGGPHTRQCTNGGYGTCHCKP